MVVGLVFGAVGAVCGGDMTASSRTRLTKYILYFPKAMYGSLQALHEPVASWSNTAAAVPRGRYDSLCGKLPENIFYS